MRNRKSISLWIMLALLVLVTGSFAGAYLTGRDTIAAAAETIGNGWTMMIHAGVAAYFLLTVISLYFLFRGKNRRVIIGAYLAICLLRIRLGDLLGAHLTMYSYHDAEGMFSLADFVRYFGKVELSPPDFMFKELGMPFLLNIVHITGIRYTTFVSLLWIIAAILSIRMLDDYCESATQDMKALAFLLILFTPIAFDETAGTLLYRNALLTPLYLICFELQLVFLHRVEAYRKKEAGSDERSSGRKVILLAVLFGAVFLIVYYIKEDGIWLLASVACLDLLYLVCCTKRIRGRQHLGRLAQKAAFLLIPMIVFAAGTVCYKAVNQHFFGLYATNARTTGEAARFVGLVYSIESADRTAQYWAPTDAIEKAFEASPTLRENAALRDEVFHTRWFWGDIHENQIYGDFLTWVMSEAIFTSGTVSDKAEAENFYRQVNSELEQAFQDGTLERDHRFRIISSMGGVTGEELHGILQSTMRTFGYILFVDGYTPGGQLAVNTESETQRASIFANMDLNAPDDEVAILHRTVEILIANQIVRSVFWLYRIVQPALCAIAILAVALSVADLIRQRRKRSVDRKLLFMVMTVLAMTGILFVYLFVIAWFCAFLPEEALRGYSVGGVSLLVLMEILGAILMVNHAGRRSRGAGDGILGKR